MQRAISITITVLVLAGGGLLLARRLRASAASDPNQYRIATAKVDLVKKTVTATGVLTPWTTVSIKSRAGGRVDVLAVDTGTVVHKGQIIAQIDPTDTLLTYNQARADIASGEAHVLETDKTLDLQKAQTQSAILTALANEQADEAAEHSAQARYESAVTMAQAQPALTKASIANARATLAAEQQKLEQMKTASHPQELAASEAALNQAKANLKDAEYQYHRNQQLLAKGYVAQSVVDQAEATYESQKAAVAMAQNKIDTIQPEFDADLKAEIARVQQARAALQSAQASRIDIQTKQQAADAAKADLEQAKANVAQAKAQVLVARQGSDNNLIRETQIDQAKAAGARARAELADARVQLDQTRVTAPSDGVILKKDVEQGTIITSGMSFNSTGTSIVEMGDISRMYVDVQVDETDIASVDEGQDVDITFDAYPTTPFEGKVIKVEPQAEIDSNVTTIHVRVEVDNSVPTYRLLKPGMNATCEFIVDKKDSALCVPNEALQVDENGDHYVLVATGGKVAPVDPGSDPDPAVFVNIRKQKRIVQIGLEGNDTTEIVSGLKDGDRVITQTIEPSTNTGGNPFGSSRGPGRK
ncbi:MAG TPA: efflux RND transporter periplasmic adaptor subunit [Chthonomonadales bacterium]|nr:efflux RND transporter periplasmic adaptor subunit [Chthonomonadales bacterium]